MPNLATNGLIMNLLLSVRQGANSFPNIDFVKANDWAGIQAVADDAALGRGLFKRADERIYTRCRERLNDGTFTFDLNDAMRFTRSVEEMTRADGEEPWDGTGVHPDTDQLRAWISAVSVLG